MPLLNIPRVVFFVRFLQIFVRMFNTYVTMMNVHRHFFYNLNAIVSIKRMISFDSSIYLAVICLNVAMLSHLHIVKLSAYLAASVSSEFFSFSYSPGNYCARNILHRVCREAMCVYILILVFRPLSDLL